MEHAAEEPVDARVRRRLPELRTERGLTLRQVAENANLDISTLGRIEAGKRRLALDHLPALAAALAVSTDTLLEPPPVDGARVREQPRRFGDMAVWPLNRAGFGGRQAYKVNIGARRRTPPDVRPTHEGADWIHVLRGPLRLLLGEDELILATGATVEFSTLAPHWLGAVDGPVELIVLVGADGDRLEG